MSKSLLLGSALLGLCLTSFASASLSEGDRIQMYNREGTGSGGEFGIRLMTSASPSGGNATTTNFDLHRTFCLEKNEYIDFGNPYGYVIDTIDTQSVGGGVGRGMPGTVPAAGGPDPLDQRTAWLFWKFAANSLSGYDYTPGSGARDASANALQDAIWYLENENQGIGLGAAFVALANNAVANFASEVAAAVANVRILNIKWAADYGQFDGVYEYANGVWSGPGPGTYAQSMLYVIPEASTIAVWSILSLVGAGVAYRKSQQK